MSHLLRLGGDEAQVGELGRRCEADGDDLHSGAVDALSRPPRRACINTSVNFGIQKRDSYHTLAASIFLPRICLCQFNKFVEQPELTFVPEGLPVRQQDDDVGGVGSVGRRAEHFLHHIVERRPNVRPALVGKR